MLDILRDYLTEAATPELREALEDAHAVFDRIDLPDYQRDFEAVLMMDGSNDQGMTLTAVTELTRIFLVDLIRKHEIVPAQDASIPMLTTILTGILDIQDYDNHYDILNVIAMESNPQETLAELLALVTAKTVEDFISDLEDVNFVVINRIRDMALAKDIPPPSEEEQAEQRAYIEKLQRFRGYLINAPLITVKMLESGLDTGFPFLTYVGLIGREFEEWPVDKIAHELMAMALISNDGTNNPTEIIQAHLENYIADMNKLTKVHIKLREIALGLQR